ncbi:MAG: Gfo/Idh/MocA family oxidoreductase [Chloroflexota bacterium]|nr:Gfo/Idh/MocA family oxidoreductase [Chloroflexota bacterium]
MTGLGVAGLGGLGEALIKDIGKFSTQLELVAVQDVRPGVAADMAARFGARWAGERFEDLLAVDGLDAVLICTPNALHAPQAQAALRLQKHVLVQKPLAVSCVDAQATIDTAAEHGRLLFVDYSYRFLETIAVLRSRLVESGPARRAHGSFHNIYGPGAEKAWFFDPKLSGGGALMDLGVHLLDLGLWLVQPAHARLLSVDMRSTPDRAVESAAVLRLLLGNTEFDLDVSWNADRPSTDITFEFQLENGSLLRWQNVDGSFFHFRTALDGEVLLDRRTTLREDTLQAFACALATGSGPAIDTRVYTLLDQAYGRSLRAPIISPIAGSGGIPNHHPV